MDATVHGAICLCRRVCIGTVLCALASMTLPSRAATATETLADLSLEELSNIEVTSVSKSAETLRAAPAAIYVITHDDILRSGVTSIAEALRLAPNLQISQYSASRYVAGARGFAGAEEAQNFSNKLLILIDGRSVYSPLFSGVYLDVQDVLMEDIDRIEVISGPGATLWGANATNGVINIITRPAYLTDEPLVSAGAGNQERTVSARYGGKTSDALAYRVYGKVFERDAQELADESSAQDDWYKAQGGFRVDWTGASDSITTQGDAYRGQQNQLASVDQDIRGGNLLSRWQRRSAHGDSQVQAYYDYTLRGALDDGLAARLRTYDLELQQRLTLGRHRLVFGAGTRLHRYDISNTVPLAFEPGSKDLWLANGFLQDTIGLGERLDLTLGLKIEHATYSGWTPLPDIRLAWRLGESALLWTSASRAIRSVTPFDHDVVESVPGVVRLTGNNDFKPEQVDAFEIGYRGQPLSRVSFTASAFYNVYDDLRSVERIPNDDLLQLQWDNQIKGQTWGVEAWAKWQVTDWWRLSPGLRTLHKDLEYKAGASRLVGLSETGNDARRQALLTSSMDLGARTSFDATLRTVGALPQPKLKSYTELQASIDHHFTQHLDVSVSGFNLLDDRHLEYPAPTAEAIRRSFIAQARWKF